jgi:hypothetical protein
LVQRSRRYEAEQPFDECGLAGDIVLWQPPYLSFADHIHRFDTLKRSPCRVKRSESLACSDPPFDRPVVPLDDVVEVTDRSA